MAQSLLDTPTAKKMDIQQISPTRAKISIEPYERGFGHTIGNTYRRILLSSIRGAAITEVTIDNVQHEYESLEGRARGCHQHTFEPQGHRRCDA